MADNLTYSTIRIDDSSYPSIEVLYRLSFNHFETIEAIRQKYDTQVFGLKNVGLLALDDQNTAAAYYGVFPIVLSDGSSDYLVAQSGDTMTAPNHRKKGLFVKLAKETYALSKELGIRMVFGFPNKNSYPGFKNNLDWVFHGSMHQFRIHVLTIPLCELSAKFPFFLKMYHRFVKWRMKSSTIPIESANLSEFKSQKGLIQIKRDAHFFRYKLKGAGVHLVKWGNFQLLIKARTHLYIGDVGHFEKDQTSELLRVISKRAATLGCKTIIFTLSQNHWLHDYLKDYCKPTESHPIGFYPIDAKLDLDKIQFSGADYDTF